MADASKEEVFKDAKERRCTDVLCLLLLLCTFGASCTLCVVSVAAEPSLLTDLIYPTDQWGNNCGYTDGFKDKKKLVFPRLDQDFQDQSLTVIAGQWWNFKPYGLCVEECPSGFDLANPMLYGGSDYTTNSGNTTADSFYYTFLTTDVLGRCMPTASSAPGATRDLCIQPNCTSPEAMELNGLYPGSITCASVESQPLSANTWQVCPEGCAEGSACCTAHRATCSGTGTLQVQEEVTETFIPTTQSEDDFGFTSSYSTYVQLVLGGYEGLIVTEGLVALTVFGVALPIVMGFVWAAFLWFFAPIIVYVLIGALVTVLLILDVVLMVKAGFFTIDEVVAAATGIDYNATSVLSTAEDTWKTWFMVLAVIMIIITVMFILFIIVNRKCIQRLIAILQEVTKVFKSMFCIVWWPFFDLVAQACVFIFGFFAIFFAANAPDSLFDPVGWKYATIIFQVLLIFWLSQFFRAWVWTSMSAAICRWYVTNTKEPYKPCCGVGSGLAELSSATCLITTKHLGTMAFGSLIIAVVQTIRAVVQMIDYYTQDIQKSNFVLSLVLKCLQYCLACIQKTIEMITYYGFVFTAMQGDPFCKACYATFEFIMQYPAQTALNKTISKVLGLLIGWTTPVLAACCAFWYLEYGAGDYPDKFNTLWAALVTFLIAFIVTTGITSIYDCAFDSIYLSAFKDMAQEGGPTYMSDDLRKGFGLDLSTNDAYVEAGAPPKLAAKHKSQTQRRREKKEGADVPATKVDVSAVSATVS